mmetsp:Transcript_26819/g.70473  ORF Transcript_26819/g.70473 Transcript_26819/m.70473 type:complete len:97 (+) Transcript_26819:418-708(+)
MLATPLGTQAPRSLAVLRAGRVRGGIHVLQPRNAKVKGCHPLGIALNKHHNTAWQDSRQHLLVEDVTVVATRGWHSIPTPESRTAGQTQIRRALGG